MVRCPAETNRCRKENPPLGDHRHTHYYDYNHHTALFRICSLSKEEFTISKDAKFSPGDAKEHDYQHHCWPRHLILTTSGPSLEQSPFCKTPFPVVSPVKFPICFMAVGEPGWVVSSYLRKIYWNQTERMPKRINYRPPPP